jgi:hypothetical protein
MLAIYAAASASAQDPLFSNEAKQKAEALLKQMTLDERRSANSMSRQAWSWLDSSMRVGNVFLLPQS